MFFLMIDIKRRAAPAQRLDGQHLSTAVGATFGYAWSVVIAELGFFGAAWRRVAWRRVPISCSRVRPFYNSVQHR